jgi:membrane protein
MNFSKFKKIKDAPELLKTSYTEWMKENPFDLGATVAYYAIFSLPALLIIFVTAASVFFEREAVQGQIVGQIGGMIGKDSAKQVQDMIANASKTGNSVVATIIGVITLLFGATGVFLSLQDALNKVWDVQINPKKSGIMRLIKVRATSFGIILTIGFLLLVSLVISSLLEALSGWIMTILPDFMLVVFQVVNFLIAFGITTVLFAILFKYLPDAKIQWRSVWVGALLTTFLFTLAKIGLSFYFGKSNPGSTYGAAGSLILMLLWVSYSSIIVFFGAQFTKVYAEKYGHQIKADTDAVLVKDK